MSGGPQDIDWDRLDKKKFFIVGVGLFSGVTTALYPLSVIKTRQMAAHRDVAAGLAGTKQIARQIWAQEGARGFYKGFGTVVFGTIPARSVYMTTLEVTKAAVTRLGQHLDISAPALAGAASFVGGAAASASTQAVVVPIDVISQRLMMHGLVDPNTTTNTNTSSSSSGSSSGSTSATGQAAVQQQQQHPLRQAGSAGGAGQAASAAPAASASAAGVQQQQQQPGTRGMHTSSIHAQPSSSSSSSDRQLRMRQHAAAARTQQPLQQLGSSSGSIPTTSRSSSSLPRPHPMQQQQRRLHQQHQQPCRIHPGGRLRPLSSVAAVESMNGFQMARLIVQQEGVKGLYRGFWPSLATFVPNSALWWGAYGFWQRFLWEQLPLSVKEPAAGGSSSGSSVSAGGTPSTGVVVSVQTTAAVLSGCTASVLTNPLDLVKTRLQVAAPVDGVVPSWRSLFRELLAEEGLSGLMRGVAPRMASSAMWGTAMVSVYEFLKRLCAQP